MADIPYKPVSTSDIPDWVSVKAFNTTNLTEAERRFAISVTTCSYEG